MISTRLTNVAKKQLNDTTNHRYHSEEEVVEEDDGEELLLVFGADDGGLSSLSTLSLLLLYSKSLLCLLLNGTNVLVCCSPGIIFLWLWRIVTMGSLYSDILERKNNKGGNNGFAFLRFSLEYAVVVAEPFIASTKDDSSESGVFPPQLAISTKRKKILLCMVIRALLFCVVVCLHRLVFQEIKSWSGMASVELSLYVYAVSNWIGPARQERSRENGYWLFSVLA